MPVASFRVRYTATPTIPSWIIYCIAHALPPNRTTNVFLVKSKSSDEKSLRNIESSLELNRCNIRVMNRRGISGLVANIEANRRNNLRIVRIREYKRMNGFRWCESPATEKGRTRSRRSAVSRRNFHRRGVNVVVLVLVRKFASERVRRTERKGWLRNEGEMEGEISKVCFD